MMRALVSSGVVVLLASLLGMRGDSAVQSDRTVLDRDQHLVSFEDLDYPAIPRAARIQGVVVIEATLDDAGGVVSAIALSGAPGLIEPAAANARKWKFQPNRQKRAIIVYDFQIGPGACHDRARSLFSLEHTNLATIRSCENVIEG